jgi:hypothetical protein
MKGFINSTGKQDALNLLRYARSVDPLCSDLQPLPTASSHPLDLPHSEIVACAPGISGRLVGPAQYAELAIALSIPHGNSPSTVLNTPQQQKSKAVKKNS